VELQDFLKVEKGDICTRVLMF